MAKCMQIWINAMLYPLNHYCELKSQRYQRMHKGWKSSDAHWRPLSRDVNLI